LTVDNMYCEACPYIVKKTLERVSRVSKVTVSFNEKIAVVVFDRYKSERERPDERSHQGRVSVGPKELSGLNSAERTN